MKIKIERKGIGDVFLKILEDVVKFNKENDYWAHDVLLVPKEVGETPYFQTFSKKGIWYMINSDTIEFRGYQNSFLDGSRFFWTSELLEEDFSYTGKSSNSKSIIINGHIIFLDGCKYRVDRKNIHNHILPIKEWVGLFRKETIRKRKKDGDKICFILDDLKKTWESIYAEIKDILRAQKIFLGINTNVYLSQKSILINKETEQGMCNISYHYSNCSWGPMNNSVEKEEEAYKRLLNLIP